MGAVFGARAARLTLVSTVLVVAGCGGGPSVPPGPVVSPTGIVYEPGTPPTSTRYSQTAALYLRSGEPERALELALEGMAADSANPIHYFLAGVGHARLREYETADALLDRAQAIYPAYELEIEPERQAAWAEAFNRGTEAYAVDDVGAAIAAWRGAALMYRLRPEAHRNLAMLLAQEGRLDEAAEIYQDLVAGLGERPATRVLDDVELRARERDRWESEDRLAQVLLMTNRFAEAEPLLRAQLARSPGDVQVRQNLASALSGQDRWDEARIIYDDLLSESDLQEAQLFNLGVALFRAEAPEEAARAFERLTEARPRSRDAWFNYANALLASSNWIRLVEVGDRILEVDPLNETAALIVARAHLETGDEQGALGHLERIDSAPVHVEGLLMRSAGPTTVLEGRVVGKQAEAGAPVSLRFTFYGDGREARTETVLPAPSPGASEGFEVTVDLRATAYRYELVEPAELGPGA